MKRSIITLVLVMSVTAALAQERKTSAFHKQKASMFAILTVDSDDIVFLGDSITQGCEWAELFDDCNVKNRGVSADTTLDMLDLLGHITAGQPKKLFLMIGINDMGRDNTTPRQVIENIALIADRIGKESPRTELFIQSILPVGRPIEGYNYMTKSNDIRQANEGLKELCRERGLQYLDIYSHMTDEEGYLKGEYSNDRLHLLGAGYFVWRDLIKEYVK